ncbi:hypothetical protein [Phaeocystidibacter luteus]|uniref:Uncharacterized protein n=1 Tax=Phaeocystidibacter luteus TaxID=911197 RepID=A0A6N6RK17_9FLAO|nr:hypothetical protein [Phaeocystidibacter luteus]KAB2814215.1 hypothetical protein F8C67_00360 [Phaeocystidibacter luteus]
MSNQRHWLLLFMLTLPFLGWAQTRTLEELTDEIVTSVTTSYAISDSLFISLEEYHLLIERQPLSRDAKSDFKQEVNDIHETQTSEFYDGLKALQRIYVSEINNGATMKLDSIWLLEVDGTRNIYEIRLEFHFEYEDDEQSSQLYLDSMVGAVRRRFSFLSPLVEAYE